MACVDGIRRLRIITSCFALSQVARQAGVLQDLVLAYRKSLARLPALQVVRPPSVFHARGPGAVCAEA